MSVRTVTLSADAYAALAARKKAGESFSDVVRRLTGLETSPLGFVGTWRGFPEKSREAFDQWLTWSDRRSIEEQGRPSRRR